MRKIRFTQSGERLLRPRKSERKRLVFLFLFILAGMTLVLINTAEAQVKDKIKGDIEKTDVVIESAKEAVAESRNPKAENLLELTIKLQRHAHDAFRDTRFKLALELTLKARKMAYEAIGFTKRGEENENLVFKAIEKTDQIIADAQEVTNPSENIRASALLDVASHNQQRAKEFLKEHKLKAALKLTMEARGLAQKVLDLMSKGKNLDRQAKRQLEITDRLIEKASPFVQESRNQGAMELFDQAKNLQEKARDWFDQKRLAEVIKSSQEARNLVKDALNMVGEDVTAEMVESAIQQNQRLIEKGEEKMKANMSPDAKNTFKEGLAHQKKAQESYDLGKYKAALAEAKVAKRLLSKALGMIGEGRL